MHLKQTSDLLFGLVQIMSNTSIALTRDQYVQIMSNTSIALTRDQYVYNKCQRVQMSIKCLCFLVMRMINFIFNSFTIKLTIDEL